MMIRVMVEIRVRRELVEEVERFIEEKRELGYVDAEDFIRDALRHLLFHRGSIDVEEA